MQASLKLALSNVFVRRKRFGVENSGNRNMSQLLCLYGYGTIENSRTFSAVTEYDHFRAFQNSKQELDQKRQNLRWEKFENAKWCKHLQTIDDFILDLQKSIPTQLFLIICTRKFRRMRRLGLWKAHRSRGTAAKDITAYAVKYGFRRR